MSAPSRSPQLLAIDVLGQEKQLDKGGERLDRSQHAKKVSQVRSPDPQPRLDPDGADAGLAVIGPLI
jgi:hypothetical protein